MSAEQQQSKDTPTPGRGKKRSRSGSKVDGDELIREKIAQLEEPFRSIAARLHELIRSTAPELTPRLWYGLPAYTIEGAVICFFRGPETFGERYLTFGFSDKAQLDDGLLWPVAFALTGLTSTEEAQIIALVRRAVGLSP